MKRVNASKLRHRVTFLQRVVEMDKWNQPQEMWVIFAEVWANVEPITGREYWASSQVQSEVTHRIRIRYLPGLDPSMLALFKGRVFELQPPRNVEERNQEMEILATERDLVPDLQIGDGINSDAILEMLSGDGIDSEVVLGSPDSTLGALARLLGGG